MRTGKRVLSLLVYVLTPTLGACGAVEGLDQDETLVQTEEQVQSGLAFKPFSPSSVSHPAYTHGGAYTVTWGSSLFGETYQLEEQFNEGVWTPLYHGPERSFYVSGRNAGEYNYRVRGCNSGGCGSYRTSTTIVVNPKPVVDLYAEYPFLYTHDQQNAQYAAQNQSFRTGFQQTSPATLTPVDGNFYLGQGVNLLKGEPAQICVDTNHPSFQIVSNPVNARTFSVERATSLTHLSQLLDVDVSGGLSLGLKDFTLDVTGSKKRLSEQTGDSYRETIVARWENKVDHWTLNTIAEPLKPDFASSMLIPLNPNAQSRFRERCGDKYIHAVTRGARLYFVFSFDAKSYSSTERQQKAATLTAKIKEVLSLNGGGSVSLATALFLKSTGVEIKAYAVGGNTGVEVDITHTNFGTKFQEFVTTVNTSNVAAIQQFTSHYDQPTQFLNYSYFQVFADYRTPLDQLRRWTALELERFQRCKLLENYGFSTASCTAAGQEMETAMENCMETVRWGKCAHPLSYYTEIGSGGVPASNSLYTWMGQNINALDRVAASQYFDHHVVGSWGSKKCESFTDNTCLPSPSCAVDTTQGANDGLGQGFNYVQHYWDVPGSGSSNSHSIPAGTTCIQTLSTLCTSQFGDTTADFRFTQEIFGQCPATRSFSQVF
ncbi:hypothetical protein ACN28I_43160 [Archangium gephyra]|uniref:hypothetical protein n=1 Tax=Archangium gephyra TaxID=48 RepID=UPI003B7B7606